MAVSYLALDRGRPRFRQGFSCLAVLRYRFTESSSCRVRGFHPLCPAFPKPFHYDGDLSLRGLRPNGPTTPAYSWFRLFQFRSPLLPESLLISVPEVHEMVQFPQCGFRRLCIQRSDTGISPSGLPHSAIRGSQDICSFPRLFAACHGLLRLATPRHSPIDPYSLDHIIVLEFFASRKTSEVLQAKLQASFASSSKLHESRQTFTRPSLVRRMRSILRKKLAQQASILSNITARR